MKKRAGRTYLIYRITNKITNEFYIGVTYCFKRQIKKSLKRRWRGHIYRATIENSYLKLSCNIRQYGQDNFTIVLEEKVIGKTKAYSRELQIIKILKPTLNHKGCK